MEIVFISKNKNGDFYVGYKIQVNRGIRGKSRAHVDELLIVGIPKERFPKFCKQHNIVIRKEEK